MFFILNIDYANSYSNYEISCSNIEQSEYDMLKEEL